MAGVDADVFEIEGADGSEAPQLVRALPWVRGVTQLGLRLRVLADRGERDAEDKLRALLREHGIDATHRAHATPASRTCSWSRRRD